MLPRPRVRIQQTRALPALPPSDSCPPALPPQDATPNDGDVEAVVRLNPPKDAGADTESAATLDSAAGSGPVGSSHRSRRMTRRMTRMASAIAVGGTGR